MSAAQALKEARAAGIRVSVEGDALALEADSAPSPALVDRLKRHKSDVVRLLRPGDDGWSAEDWQLFYEQQVSVAQFESKLPRHQAESRAFACCQAHWLKRNPVSSEPGRCLGCKREDHPHDQLVAYGKESDGLAWLHSRCWPAWYRGRKAGAVTALANMGIRASADFPDS